MARFFINWEMTMKKNRYYYGKEYSQSYGAYGDKSKS